VRGVASVFRLLRVTISLQHVSSSLVVGRSPSIVSCRLVQLTQSHRSQVVRDHARDVEAAEGCCLLIAGRDGRMGLRTPHSHRSQDSVILFTALGPCLASSGKVYTNLNCRSPSHSETWTIYSLQRTVQVHGTVKSKDAKKSNHGSLITVHAKCQRDHYVLYHETPRHTTGYCTVVPRNSYYLHVHLHTVPPSAHAGRRPGGGTAAPLTASVCVAWRRMDSVAIPTPPFATSHSCPPSS
jgi:hypothetical protein